MDFSKHSIGIDIGSVSVKIAVLNENSEIIKTVYRRFHGRPYQTLINLLENAVEAMNDHGRIWIRTDYNVDLQMVTLEVGDEGEGIQPEDREKLFLPYFSRRKSGTGLGLAIVDRIVKDHGGYIRVKDNTPRGTKFVIELPAAA